MHRVQRVPVTESPGPHPHLRRRRPGAARGRGGRRQRRPERPAHRRLPVVRARAGRASTPPTPPSGSRTCPAASWSARRTRRASCRTRSPRCGCCARGCWPPPARRPPPTASDQRRSQVRTVDRSERVRTYNFPENRIADHRVGYKAHNLDQVLDGDLDAVIDALIARAHRRAAGGRLLSVRDAARRRRAPARRRRRRVAARGRRAAARPRARRVRAAGCSPSTRCGPTTPPASARWSTQRADRVPLQHLTGRAAFRHLELAVGPGVFVPRPETEQLAGWALERLAGIAGARRRRPRQPAPAPSRCRSRTSTPAPGSPPSSATPAPSSGPGTTRPARAAAGDTPVEVVAGDMTDPALLRGARRHGRPSSSPTRPTCPTARGCRARWPTTTRRWRCGAARTGSTSSAGCWSPPPGCCGRAGGSASSTPTSRASALPALVRAHGGWTDVEDHPDLAGRPALHHRPPGRRPVGETAARGRPLRLHRPRPARAAGLDAAAAAIARGELVLLPTDTVYGVAADAFTPAAVTGLLAAKNRGRTMPVPVLIGEASTLAGLVVNLPPVAHELAQAFWPGGLTLVARARAVPGLGPRRRRGHGRRPAARRRRRPRPAPPDRTARRLQRQPLRPAGRDDGAGGGRAAGRARGRRPGRRAAHRARPPARSSTAPGPRRGCCGSGAVPVDAPARVVPDITD